MNASLTHEAVCAVVAQDTWFSLLAGTVVALHSREEEPIRFLVVNWTRSSSCTACERSCSYPTRMP